MGWGDVVDVIDPTGLWRPVSTVIAGIFGDSGLPASGPTTVPVPASPPAPPGPHQDPTFLGPLAGQPPGPVTTQPPPSATPPDAGAAATAAAADAAQTGDAVAELSKLDKTSATALQEIHDAGVEGRAQLDTIDKDVEAKMRELGPRLNTPEGQQQLRDFLKDRITAAQKIIDTHTAAAEDAARKTHESASRYDDVGSGSNANSSAPSSTPPTSGDAPAAAAATQPAAVNPATSSTPPTSGTPMSGMPMSGMPMGMGGLPSFGMPSFGSGGTPSMGSDPFSSSGMPHGQNVGFTDDPPKTDPPKTATEPTTTKPTTATTTEPTTTTPTPPTTAATDPSAPAQAGNDVRLPDGTVVQARNAQEAVAARAALAGANVADAYKQAGVDLPALGTPVRDALPPTQLQAGDVGVWKDHMVMSMGNGKVLVSGQVQPQTSLTSGPDFLGWINPTKTGAQTPTPPAASVAAPQL